MTRARIKANAAHLLSRIGVHKIGDWVFGHRNLPVVIGYHRVVENYKFSAQTSIPSQLISRKMLEKHLDWIGRRYRFVTLDEVASRFESGQPSIAPTAAITFDDGYRDFYDHAFPLLQKKGIPAAIFVVTSLIGTTEPQAHDKLYLLLSRRRGRALRYPGAPDISSLSPYQATRALIENLPLAGIQQVIAALAAEDPIPESIYHPFQSLTWEMLHTLHRAGIAVGSHTRSHVLLTNERDSVVGEEVAGSREDIQRRLGISVSHFAYPSGHFNSSATQAVADAGFRYAYTGCPHRDRLHPLL